MERPPAGRLPDILAPVDSVLVHEPCRVHWLAWTALAARYATQEEATAADRKAGRRPRYGEIVKALAKEHR
jgi:hypothetical protein